MLNGAQQQGTEVLYSRWADGGHPVLVLPDGTFEIHKPDVQPESFGTARSLLKALTGHAKARHWTFDRYFRQGRHDKTMRGSTPALDVLQLCGHPGLPDRRIILDRPDLMPPGSVLIESSTEISVLDQPGVMSDPRPTVAALGPKLGIDLKGRGHEVAKLLFAGFGHRIFGAGYDPDDVLQEVYKGLLTRNNGTCPFDERKASFGHYVHMVCGCILSNFHRKQSRRRSHEQAGLHGPALEPGDRWKMMSVHEAGDRLEAPLTVEQTTVDDTEVALDLLTYLKASPEGRQRADITALAMVILPYVQQGYGRTEIAEEISEKPSRVSQALKLLRIAARGWASQMGLSAWANA